MKNLLLKLTMIGLGLLLVTPAFAYKGGDGNHYYPGQGYCRDGGLNRLTLSDEQKAKIDKLQLGHEKEIRPIREKIFDKSVELRRLWLQTDPDRNKINTAQKEVRILRNQLEDKKTAYRFEINKMLTPEQRDKLATYGCGKGPGFGPRGGMREHGRNQNKFAPQRGMHQ